MDFQTIRIQIKKYRNGHQSEILIFAFLFGLVTIFFWPVIYYMAVEGGSQDYLLYTQYAKRMFTTGTLSRPNFLYIWLVAIFHSVLPQLDFAVLGAFMSELFYLLLSAILYLLIRSILGVPISYRRSFMYILATISLMLVSPITIFTWMQRDFYFGYLYPANIYHNPNLILAKPFSLLLFLWAVKIYNGQSRSQTKLKMQLFISGVLVVLSLLSKPNYLLCLVPALLIASVYEQYYKKISVNWRALFLGILLPAGVTLTWQFYVTYTSGNVTEYQARIIFAPFVFFSHYSTWIFPKFVLSILFPLVVYTVYAEKATKHRELNFAWLIFFFGGWYSYFLAESGPRLYDGNFVWGGQLSLFILFVVSTRFLLEQNKNMLTLGQFRILPWRLVVCASVFGGHLSSGLIWYCFHLQFLKNW